MKRHLIWIIAGAAAIGVAVPAFAAVQPAPTPDDNSIPGEVRGNCDEAEHAGDPECLTVTVAAPSAVTPSTSNITVPTASVTPGTAPTNTVPDNTTVNTAVNTVPDNTTVGTAPSNTVGTVPGNSLPGDISGPCDEAEHANDPRCTGAASSDDGAGRHSGDDDGSGHSDDDSSGHSDDDSSGHGGDDD
jgi:hypothetical protein